MPDSKLLLIDDEESIHRLVRVFLDDEGMTLHFARDSTEGLRLAAEAQPDVILLDVDLPDMNGFEICRQLKNSEATKQIPVIFLTASCLVDEKTRGLEMGAVDYITKPFDAAELRARIRATVRTKQLMDLLTTQAQIDGLTRLGNRACFSLRLQQEASLCARQGRSLACIMLDIDRFKSVNDTYGHLCGDRVLRAIADTLLASCRTEDVVCRYGGEEFVVLTRENASEGAAQLAERIRVNIASLILSHNGTPIRVTCSFGVADTISGTPDTLVARADAALYRAKRAGRNRVVLAASTDATGSPCQIT